MNGTRLSVRGGFAPALLACMLLLGSAVRAASDDPRALYKQGVQALRAGQWEEALARFDQASQADPAYPYPLFAAARIHHEQFDRNHRNYREATQGYQRLCRVLDAAPPPPRDRELYQAYYFQGLLYLRGGEYAPALDAFSRFLEVYPEFYNLAQVHNNRGVALYRLYRYEEACDAFRSAIEADGSFIEPRVNLRSVFTRLTLYEDARANLRQGYPEEALRRVETLLESAPGFLSGRRLHAKILGEVGRLDEAVCGYQELIARDPTHPLTHGARLELARLLERQGSLREALVVLNQNVRYFRDQPRDATRGEILRLVELLRANP
ncbi:MAG: tetratricopeptide repeat protein [Deferrisomatales bacterium]|nr:tetratricopeptide repeat protein [Deferrisomatales bacterium]